MRRKCPVENLNPARGENESREDYVQRRINNRIALNGKTFHIGGAKPTRIRGYKEGDFIPWAEHVGGS